MIPPAEIIARIDDATLATADRESRKYLGASVIGEACTRKLWYQFRWCGGEEFSARMLRLFERGDREEAVFKQRLESIGFVVRTPTEEDRSDFQMSDFAGHYGGTCDGVATEDEIEWFLLEFKTYNAARFKELKRHGVKHNDPKYYYQMQSYMGGLGLTKALFCAVNKDDDDLYFEWVEFNPTDYEICQNKAHLVINSPTPPDRISEFPTAHNCKYCNFKSICHENQPLPEARRHCRNCLHGSPAANGQWECGKGKEFGTLCPAYVANT